MKRAALLCLLLGCNADKKNCEHARDVVAGTAEQEAKEALATVEPTVKARLEGEAKAEIDQLRASFVQACLALGDEGKKCIARIDEFQQIEIDLDKDIAACPKDEYGFPNQACHEKATETAEGKFGSCKAELDALAEKIYGKRLSGIELEEVP